MVLPSLSENSSPQQLELSPENPVLVLVAKTSGSKCGWAVLAMKGLKTKYYRPPTEMWSTQLSHRAARGGLLKTRCPLLRFDKLLSQHFLRLDAPSLMTHGIVMVKGKLKLSGVTIATSTHKRCLLSHMGMATNTQCIANKLIYFNTRLHNEMQPSKVLRNDCNTGWVYLPTKSFISPVSANHSCKKLAFWYSIYFHWQKWLPAPHLSKTDRANLKCQGKVPGKWEGLK